jgi:muramoyltetrapeptide carboxypeptidase LdcA involved in peptidoglycan recycling
MAGFAENAGMFPYKVSSVRKTLFSSEPIGVVEPNLDGWTAEEWTRPSRRIRGGGTSTRARGGASSKAKASHAGAFIGGCLEILELLRGTEVWPEEEAWRGSILFLETSEEAPSPVVVARALRVYAAMGILRMLSGILFAKPGGGIPVERFEEYEEAILGVAVGEEGLDDLPLVTRMDFGHTDPMFVLPYGVEAEIDCGEERFSIVEGALVDQRVRRNVRRTRAGLRPVRNNLARDYRGVPGAAILVSAWRRPCFAGFMSRPDWTIQK